MAALPWEVGATEVRLPRISCFSIFPRISLGSPRILLDLDLDFDFDSDSDFDSDFDFDLDLDLTWFGLDLGGFGLDSA